MNDRRIGIGGMGIIGESSMSSIYGTAIGLLSEARKAEARLSEEEREHRKEVERLNREERFRKASITQGICPECESKLIRGKKNKKNNYKRDWECKKCKKTHSM